MPTQHLRLSLPAPSPLGLSWHASAKYRRPSNTPVPVRLSARVAWLPFPLLVRHAKWLPIVGAWSHRAWIPAPQSRPHTLMGLVAKQLRR